MLAVFRAGPLSAFASIITWNFNGSVTTAVNVPSPVVVGTPFQLSLTFDTAAPQFGLGGAGTSTGFLYPHSGASIDLSILLAGPPCNPACSIGDNPNSVFDRIYVFDDFSNTTPGAALDGLLFSTFDGNDRWNIFLSGATNLISGSGIPSLEPQFTNFVVNACTVTSTFNVVTLPNGGLVQVPNTSGPCGTGQGDFQLSAQLVPVSVPEPESFALLGIGLVGLGLTRKRKLN